MKRLIAAAGQVLPVALLALVGLALSGMARADAIDPFVGEYIGRTVEGDEMEARDASVTIAKVQDGFTLQWTTVSHRDDGTVRRKTYGVRFQPSERAGIFASGMKRNKFGALEPLDPLQGDPYVWAKIEGRTLTVYAMLITDDGGYEMQIYDRTLTDTGLDLKFSRFRDGETLKDIRASLARAKN